MKFETEAVQELVRRIRSLQKNDYAPPLMVLHRFMLLAGTSPEHLAVGYEEQTGEKPAEWSLMSLDGGLVTYVLGHGRGERSWTLRQVDDRPAVGDVTVEAVTFPVRAVTGVRVAPLEGWGHESRVLSEAWAQWVVETAGGSYRVPGADSDQAEEFAALVLDAVRESA